MSDSGILTAGLITLGSTTAASVLPASMGGKGELPAVQLLIGTSLAFFGISALNEVAPAIANPLAAAVAITAFIYYGGPMIQNYLGTKTVTTGTISHPSQRKIILPIGRKANTP